MSKLIYGNKNINLKIKSAVMPETMNVSVDIDSHLNRRTTTKALRQYVQDGFDMRLWDPPHVAELPSGERLLFDGDHSRALWKEAFPDRSVMPAVICPVESKQEISRLFVHRNKTGRIALTASEIFVLEHDAEDPEAIKLGKNLAACGLNVSLGTGVPGDTVGDLKSNMRVNIQGFKKAVQSSSVKSCMSAARLYKQYWPSDKKCQAEILHALALIYKNSDFSSDPRVAKAFKEYFDSAVQHMRDARKFGSHYKQKGGNVTNKAAESIAKGILQGLSDNCKHYGLHKKTFNKVFKSYMTKLNSTLK